MLATTYGQAHGASNGDFIGLDSGAGIQIDPVDYQDFNAPVRAPVLVDVRPYIPPVSPLAPPPFVPPAPPVEPPLAGGGDSGGLVIPPSSNPGTPLMAPDAGPVRPVAGPTDLGGASVTVPTIAAPTRPVAGPTDLGGMVSGLVPELATAKALVDLASASNTSEASSSAGVASGALIPDQTSDSGSAQASLHNAIVGDTHSMTQSTPMVALTSALPPDGIQTIDGPLSGSGNAGVVSPGGSAILDANDQLTPAAAAVAAKQTNLVTAPTPATPVINPSHTKAVLLFFLLLVVIVFVAVHRS